MIVPHHIRTHIVAPTLHALRLWSAPAEQMVMAIGAQATALGALRNEGGRLAAGHAQPAADEPLGLWGVTPARHARVTEWLQQPAQAPLLEALPVATGVAVPDARWLIGNLHYGAAVVALWLEQVGQPSPFASHEQARYAAAHWHPDYAHSIDALIEATCAMLRAEAAPAIAAARDAQASQAA